MATDTTTPANNLAPPNVDDHKDTLASHLSAVLQIRGYALAVEQTVLLKITDPPPDWWDTINTNLGTAQGHAQTWTNTLEPAITSTIPQAVISTGTRFNTAATDILNILQAAGTNPPTSDQQATILEDLQWMSSHLGQIETNISTLKNTFTQFQTDSGTDFQNLSSGSAAIQKALNVDEDTITRLNGDILAAQADIAADNAAITASGIAGGVGLFVGVGMIGLGAAAGPAAPFVIGIGAFIVVGSIVEMATVISIYAQKLAAAQNRLNDDQAQLALEQQQVASLTALGNTISNLTDLNKAMGQSLSEIADWWAGVKAKLDVVITDVQDATDDMGFWHQFTLDITTAKTDWQQFSDFATNMQAIATGAPTKSVDVAPPVPAT